MSADAPVPAAVLEQAIAWQLRLDAGDSMTSKDLTAWLAADEAHRRAWRQLGALDRELAPMQAAPARAALLRPRPKRGRAAGAVAALAFAAACGVAALDRHLPLPALFADYGTATGERRRLELPDRSVVHLNSRTAVDLVFDSERRALRVLHGEILVETAHAADPRPFVVLTEDGALRALGTRFLVRKQDGGTLLTVLRSAVAARPAAAPQVRVVQAGERITVHAHGMTAPQPAPADADAWQDGVLVVDDVPLGAVVAELARYRHGYLSVDERLAALRVSGTFSLDDTDLALQTLARGLALRIVRRGDWWVSISGT